MSVFDYVGVTLLTAFFSVMLTLTVIDIVRDARAAQAKDHDDDA